MTAFTRSVLWALLAATLTAAVLIFIFALWAFNSDDPSSLVGPLGMTAFFYKLLYGRYSQPQRRGEYYFEPLVRCCLYSCLLCSFTYI